MNELQPITHYVWRRYAVLLALCTAIASSAWGNVRIVVDSTTLDFGGLELTQSLDRTVNVTNPSGADVQIDGVSFTGLASTDFSVVSPPSGSFPVVIPAGSTSPLRLIIRFTPKLLGTRSATLSIETSDGNLDIPVAGKGIGEQSTVSFSLTSINFGKVAPSGERDTLLWLHSSGTDSATITGIQVTNASGGIDFTAALRDTNRRLPTRIAPGDSLAIDIAFTGLLPEGAKFGSVTIFANAAALPICALQGTVGWATGQFDSAQIDFGQMYVGEIRADTVFYRNTSDVDADITDIQLSSLDFHLEPMPPLPLHVAAGTAYPFIVVANPSAVGARFAQLLTISRTTDTNLRTVNLRANAIPSPLRLYSDTVSALCLFRSALPIHRWLRNDGDRPYTVTEIIAADTSSLLSAPPAPIVVGAHDSVALDFEVNATSLISGDGLVFEYYGGAQLVLKDTVWLNYLPINRRSTIATQTITDEQDAFSVRVDTSLNAFRLGTLVVHLNSASLDHAVIEPGTITIDPSLATAQMSLTTEPGGYAVTIQSTQPLVFDNDGDVLNFHTLRYVTAIDTSSIKATIEAPEWAGCLTIDSATAMIGTPGCGSAIISTYLGTSGLQLLGMSRQPRSLLLKLQSHIAGEANIQLVTSTGKIALRTQLALSPGYVELPIRWGTLPSGNYFVHLDGPLFQPMVIPVSK